MKPRRADRWLLMCLSAFFVTSGAALWETILFVPAWSRAAPASLRVFAAPYSIDPSLFWGVEHTAFELILSVTLVVNWRLQNRRLPLLGVAVLYAVTRLWTLIYFAPAFIHFHHIPASSTVDTLQTQLTTRWRDLNYVRTTLVVAGNVLMLWLCMRALLPWEGKRLSGPNDELAGL